MTHEPVLVGIDSSVDAMHALAWATEYASAVGTPLVVVHALGLLERRGAGPPVPTQAHRDEIVQHFAELVGQHCGVGALFVARDGEPLDVLQSEAAVTRASLIVVGRRGEGGTAKSLGSTSTQLVEHARRPVVVVPNVT